MKKLQICLLILVILIVAISGCVSSNNNSNNKSLSSNASGSNVSTSNDSIIVNYPGEWSGTISDSSGTRTIGGSGSKTINLGSVSGSLQVVARKTDNGSKTLTLSLVKNGKTVETQSTSGNFNYVSIMIY